MDDRHDHAGALTDTTLPIDSVARLRIHLQWAIELEHATIPPYLFALYSIDRERNREAVEVLTSVFVEEMLHLTLAANLLNAVGGTPRVDSPGMLPGHPRCLPHGDRSFEVALLPFGPAAIELFMRTEHPAPIAALPQRDRYETIGQFYDAIRRGLVDLSALLGEDHLFSGDPARQVTEEQYYGGSGRIIAVDGLTPALAALDEIVAQGEGGHHVDVWDGDREMFHPERREVGHYYRFHELQTGRRYQQGDTPRSGPTGPAVHVDWEGVLPVRPNPRPDDHPAGSPVRVAQVGFNRAYCELLELLERVFNGSPTALETAVGAMYALKSKAEALMSMPDGLDPSATAGPTFEWVPPDAR